MKHELKLKLQNSKTIKDINLDQFTVDDFYEHIQFPEQGYNRIPLVVTTSPYPSRIAYLLCWNRFQSSGIHDHPEGGCLVKVLQGRLHEETADGTTLLRVGGISYQGPGVKGLHCIRSSKYRSISLHIYEPADYKPTPHSSF